MKFWEIDFISSVKFRDIYSLVTWKYQLRVLNHSSDHPSTCRRSTFPAGKWITMKMPMLALYKMGPWYLKSIAEFQMFGNTGYWKCLIFCSQELIPDLLPDTYLSFLNNPPDGPSIGSIHILSHLFQLINIYICC